MNKTMGLLVVILMVLCNVVAAQSPKNEEQNARNSLQAGAWALQFRITEYFTLSDFQGAVISLKHHRSTKSAFRLGVNFGFEKSDQSNSQVATRDDTVTVYPDRDQSTHSYNLNLELQYVRYPNPSSRVNLFFGVGPLFGYSHSYRLDEYPGYNTDENYTTWRVGAVGQCGVEWFAIKSLSFHAEYGLRFEYYWTEIDRFSWDIETRVDGTVKRDGADFDASWVLFGLSAYF